MGLLDLFKPNQNAEAALIALRKTLKYGKTDDQCECIDFLVRPNQLYATGCKLLSKFKSDMDMNEYVAYVQKTMDSLNLKQRALEKIGLDESQISEIPPVVLSGFSLKGNNVWVQSEEGKIKGTYRNVSNIYSVTYIFFSTTQIYTYEYVFDSISYNVNEFTRDFFYSDVTCIRTNHEVEEVIIEKKKGCGCLSMLKGKKKKFFTANRDWDSFQITVPGDSYSFACATTDTLEQSIQAAKALIREKKGL